MTPPPDQEIEMGGNTTPPPDQEIEMGGNTTPPPDQEIEMGGRGMLTRTPLLDVAKMITDLLKLLVGGVDACNDCKQCMKCGCKRIHIICNMWKFPVVDIL